MLINNGGCRLPCFWGITPGKTTVGEFLQFVNQFPEESQWMEHETGFYTFYYKPPLDVDYAFSVKFFDDSNLISGIAVEHETAYLSFPLTRLLTEYGMPDTVLIGLIKSPGDEQNYQMIVLYEKERIVGQYFLNPNNGYICYDPKKVTGIITWAEGKHWQDYANQLFGKFTDQVLESSLKPLDQMTVYDLDTFYEQFSTRNRPICMKTLTLNP